MGPGGRLAQSFTTRAFRSHPGPHSSIRNHEHGPVARSYDKELESQPDIGRKHRISLGVRGPSDSYDSGWIGNPRRQWEYRHAQSNCSSDDGCRSRGRSYIRSRV